MSRERAAGLEGSRDFQPQGSKSRKSLLYYREGPHEVRQNHYRKHISSWPIRMYKLPAGVLRVLFNWLMLLSGDGLCRTLEGPATLAELGPMTVLFGGLWELVL